MVVIFTKQKIEIPLEDDRTCLLQPPDGSTLPGTDLPRAFWLTTAAGFARMGQALAARGIEPPIAPAGESFVRAAPGFPAELGTCKRGELQRNLHVSGIRQAPDPAIFRPPPADLEQQAGALPGKKPRIILLNGLGGGIGDTVVGLTALRVAIERIRRQRPGFTIDVVVDRFSAARLSPVLRQSGLVDDIHLYPMPIAQFLAYDAFFDLGGMAQLEDFRELSCLDFFLKAMGIDPASVPADQRRNRIDIDAATAGRLKPELDRLADDALPLVMFHPTATAELRSIPRAELQRMVARIHETLPCKVVTVTDATADIPGVTDLRRLSDSFAAFCYIISRMDRILTVDTAIYHIADSFDVPTAVWFTSIDPAKRVADYPRTVGIMLENDPASGILGKNASREQKDLERIRRLWKDVDPADALRELDRIADRREARPPE